MSQHDVFSRTSQFTYGTSFIIHLHCWTDTRTYSFTSGYIGVSTNFYKKSMSGCAQFTNGFSHRRWWHGLTTPLFLTFWQMDDKTCPVCKLRCSRKDVMLRHSCPTIFLSRSQYELSRMFSVFLSCMDNATSYQTACCGVIDNVAILHWLNIISYAYHHDMFVN
jgi:hypothetical protein